MVLICCSCRLKSCGSLTGIVSIDQSFNTAVSSSSAIVVQSAIAVAGNSNFDYRAFQTVIQDSTHLIQCASSRVRDKKTTRRLLLQVNRHFQERTKQQENNNKRTNNDVLVLFLDAIIQLNRRSQERQEKHHSKNEAANGGCSAAGREGSRRCRRYNRKQQELQSET